MKASASRVGPAIRKQVLTITDEAASRGSSSLAPEAKTFPPIGALKQEAATVYHTLSITHTQTIYCYQMRKGNSMSWWRRKV
uniref:Uncharacterized protein n=1 Tax=Brassica oleracea TaxID=3712 RepID=A0A3P6DNC9_BRAOL|nr:unnamed protein product [Brassica oleracea]